MTTLREVAQQALEYMKFIGKMDMHPEKWAIIGRLEAALAEPVLQTCNCRWDGEVQVQQCTLHEAHVDAIHEWAERAKTAEKKLAALAEPDSDSPERRCGGPGCDMRCCQPVEEPAALLTTWVSETEAVTEPLFRATPPRRRLTDAEISEVWFAAAIPGLTETSARLLIRAAEERLGASNG